MKIYCLRCINAIAISFVFSHASFVSHPNEISQLILYEANNPTRTVTLICISKLENFLNIEKMLKKV